MAEELRETQQLNNPRYTLGQEGTINGAYFQFGYFQNDYFQAGVLEVAGNTDAITAPVHGDRFTVRLD